MMINLIVIMIIEKILLYGLIRIMDWDGLGQGFVRRSIHGMYIGRIGIYGEGLCNLVGL